MTKPVLPEAVRRQKATAATEARFRWKPFGWKEGNHCLAMAHGHLKAMGHKVPKLPRVRGMLGARRLLDDHGWATVAEMIDAQGLERIRPAAMKLGDLAFRSSPDGLGGLLICVSAHKLMGWFPENTVEAIGHDLMVVMDMSFDQVEAAWRV